MLRSFSRSTTKMLCHFRQVQLNLMWREGEGRGSIMVRLRTMDPVSRSVTTSSRVLRLRSAASASTSTMATGSTSGTSSRRSRASRPATPRWFRFKVLGEHIGGIVSTFCINMRHYFLPPICFWESRPPGREDSAKHIQAIMPSQDSIIALLSTPLQGRNQGIFISLCKV